MKYVIVGDIHGKVDAVKEALSREGHKVFVGDFMDSYDKEDHEHLEALDLALAASKAGEATLLFGNHELSYFMGKHRCSGYRRSFEGPLKDRFDDIQSNFKMFFKPAENWLITHAGLHPEVLKALGKPLEELTEAELLDTNSPVHWIGAARWGRDPVGGIFWCDFRNEFTPVDGLNQVFGHTRGGQGIRKMEGKNSDNYCIDCLDRTMEFLTLEL